MNSSSRGTRTAAGGAAARARRRWGRTPGARGAVGFTLASLVAGGLAACSPTIHTDGQIPDPVKLASIAPGKQTQEQVVELLGTPSAVSSFDENTWYYISKRTRTTAFLDPEVIEQRVVVISFDDSGLVRGVRQHGLDSAKAVSPVARATPTKGKTLTVWDQMIGNLNRGYKPK